MQKRREYVLDGDDLTLRTQPVLFDGLPASSVLSWRRAEKTPSGCSGFAVRSGDETALAVNSSPSERFRCQLSPEIWLRS